jgi:hypothetical protein
LITKIKYQFVTSSQLLDKTKILKAQRDVQKLYRAARFNRKSRPEESKGTLFDLR